MTPIVFRVGPTLVLHDWDHANRRCRVCGMTELEFQSLQRPYASYAEQARAGCIGSREEYYRWMNRESGT
jgi:hypothetical protein